MQVSRKKQPPKKSGVTGTIATLLYLTTLGVIVLFWVNNSIEHWL